MENIPDLSIEKQPDGLILLEQDSGGNLDRVAIHRIQIRHLCELVGLAETADPEALQAITGLERRLQVLRERVEHLAEYLANSSDTEHADLAYEQTYARATADIAEQFCHDIGDNHE